MAGVARIGDRTFGYCSSHDGNFLGTVIGGSSDVKANSQGIARLGDTVLSDCGHTGTINSANASVNVNGIKAARNGDSFTGTYSGTITEGSTDVIVP